MIICRYLGNDSLCNEIYIVILVRILPKAVQGTQRGFLHLVLVTYRVLNSSVALQEDEKINLFIKSDLLTKVYILFIL